MNNRNFKLPEDLELLNSNYLQWKPCMKNLLTLFGYYHLITRTETNKESTSADKLDPRRKEKALAILCLNCDVKMGDQFILESNDDPSTFWEVINKSFSPNLIDENKTKPSVLIDSMIAMWVIINLPSHLKLIGEIFLQNYNGDKNPPLLKHLWEEFHLYTQRHNHKINSNTSALVSIQGNPTTNPLNSNSSRQNQPKNFPCCSPGWHNPLTKHKEEDCSYLKPKNSKPTVALNTQALIPSNSVIILDSGATDSMFNQLSYFVDFIESPRTIVLANGSQITAKGIGTVKIKLPNSHLKIQNILYCPELSNCLLSIGALLKNHYILQPLDNNKFQMIDQSKKVLLDGDYSSGTLIITQGQKHQTNSILSVSNRIMTLHQSSGHPSSNYLSKMYPHLNIPPISCLTCDLCKMTKMPFPGHFPKPSSKGESLHLDLCGPITPPSESGAKYFLQVVYSFYQYVWVFFLQSKSEAKDKVKNLILQIQKTPESMVSNIVSNNGTEFKNFDLLSFFQKEGISHLVTSPYTPQQNSIAERGN
ncbi:hypothetical protein O181_019566 [Austropuccinia psidii MF-1]|uniref:Integrase catalytic domain-containing protein n=1 Tax=Austropuccinia psidii MF-1 TaxID=1389203 RepID=A0A9Q3C7E5_9BASI|nr:hypothetical protein [Austropuccinia psidii MF-1]